MKIPIKTNITYTEAIVSVFTIFVITVFCKLAQFSLIIPVLIMFLGIHLFLFNKASMKLFINLGLLLTLLVVMTYTISNYADIPVYFTPVASIAMLTMLLYNDLELAFLMSFASAVLVSLVLGGDFNLMLTFLFGNLTAAYTVRDARTRGKLISAGFYVSVIQIVCIILLHPEKSFMFSREFVLNYIRPLCVNGFISAFVVISTLKIFESLFGVLTNYSLLELSDFNQPLLKRMILEAPGTYHHSLVVSNLAESASDSIGANALLTRVGSYYHDIGKMEKSEYFTENQLLDVNKHDNIEPSISRLVILNHVKEGVELAKKYKLNPLIIDFITQHHGTSLMYYFYQKSLEEAEDDETVDEGNFRYPGPKPQSRETAIVLLADSVEGATRSLEDPNPKRIEALVRKVINNKFIDGQLDECNLTLKEIESISVTFTRVLSAMYHSRVKYPEKKNGDNRGKKPAEDSTSKPPADKNNRKSYPAS